MDHLKIQLELKLIAGLLKDRGKLCEGVVFEEAWCTQERVIRFTTPLLRALCPQSPDRGFDKTGETALYEVANTHGRLEVFCRLYTAGLPKEHRPLLDEADFDALCFAFSYQKPDDAVTWFDAFLNDVLPSAESALVSSVVSASQEEVLTEGAARSIASTRYERNRRARQICLAYHGHACAVCGMNFGASYGASFADVIEVHHVVPVSEIGETYVVDPIRDLVPLCPNCHTVIHTKKGGAYSVEELREMINRTEIMK